jgi:hypothetical protein
MKIKIIRYIRRHLWVVPAGIVLIVAAIVTPVVLAASASATPVHVRGTLNLGGLGGMCFSPGDQVTITDPTGKVLASPVLPLNGVKKTVGGAVQLSFPYSATVPAETRYGVTVGNLKPYYVSEAEFTRGLDLTCQ